MEEFALSVLLSEVLTKFCQKLLAKLASLPKFIFSQKIIIVLSECFDILFVAKSFLTGSLLVAAS